jgi:hypothetical protein
VRAVEWPARSGRGATVAHVLWEHEDVGSNPTAPTNPRAAGGFDPMAFVCAEYHLCPIRGRTAGRAVAF